MSEPKRMTKKEAKHFMKRYKLIWEWDSMLNEGDVQCFCGEWWSNPIHGMVRLKDNNVAINGSLFDLVERCEPFTELIEKVKDDGETRWFVKTFYNKDQYNNYAKERGFMCKESFDEFWKRYKFKEDYNYDNYPIGHGYRDIFTGEIFGKPGKNREQVIAFGFYQTPNPKLVKCPICDELHRIGYYRTLLPVRMKFIEWCNRRGYKNIVNIHNKFRKKFGWR